MVENASIFIPDISGYTEFLSQTEIEHSAHIINDLLKVLVDANFTGLSLLEIEGDALLFYRKGEPISFEQIEKQCVTMFKAFHARLQTIDRGAKCGCDACRTAINLTLKFVVHYGMVSEISVASFVKASGIDMVIAHRLLKNRIDSHEYILATERYFGQLKNTVSSAGLKWLNASEKYPTVGRIDFRYASLQSIKDTVSLLPRAPA